MIPSDNGVRQAQATPPAHNASCAPASTQNEHHATDAEIKAAAARVKDAGEQFLTDDYNQRADVFASEMGKLDVESRAKLFDAVATNDPGAFNHWLSPDRIGDLVKSGKISSMEQGKIAEGFANAYNNGDISPDQASEFLQVNNATSKAPGFQLDSFDSMQSFLGSSCGPEMTEFREDFGRETLRREVDSLQHPGGAFPNSLKSALAVKIMADSGDADMVARAYASFNAPDRATLRDSIAEGSTGYVNSGEMDPLSTLINSVGHRGSNSQVALDYTTGSGVRKSDKFGEMANELVQFASDNKEYFFDEYDSTKPDDTRAEAMGTLLNTHRNAILDKFADFDITPAAGGNDVKHEFVNNAVALGNLFRLTTLNSDNSHQTANLKSVTDYAMKQKEALVKDPHGPNADVYLGRLTMLGGAMLDGIKQGYIDLAKDEAATKALVGFVVDVALAAVPVPKLISDGGKSAVSGLFKNEAIDKALQSVVGNVIDKQTGQLTDAGKAAIVKALGSQAGGLEAQKSVAAAVIESGILGGLPGDMQFSLEVAITTALNSIDKQR
jgi:hypothetical protein